MPNRVGRTASRSQGKSDRRYATAAIRHALNVTLVFLLCAVLYVCLADDVFPTVPAELDAQVIANAPRFLAFAMATAVLVFIAAWWMSRQWVEAQRKLDKSEKELVMRLGQAAEWRDDETGDHTLRVGEYCSAIARGMGWNDEKCERIRVAAMLHDIGKIGIPDFVMVKEGELNAEERQLIQAHTLMGSDILADSEVPLIQMAQRIAASHHEKWDGTGYPYAIAGKDIPIEARIASLADVFDALTSRRRYKDAWSFENSVDEIKTLSGTHFDPLVVRAFVDVLPQMRAIYDKFTSTARLFNINRAA